MPEIIEVKPEAVQIAARTPEEVAFDLYQRKGKLLAASAIIPKAFQGKVADCCIAIDLAERFNLHPLMVMQNCAIVHGKPSWMAQFLIALVNQSGQFTRLHYVFTGSSANDSWGCYVKTTERATGEELRGPEVTIGMAKAEGWYSKDGSKWRTMPQLMLTYRAAAFFTRTFCPELAMGLHTETELEDIEQPVRIAEPQGLMDLLPQQ